MTASGEAPHAPCVVPVGCDAAQAACTVVRQSITHCCALDHHHDTTILNAWLANKTPENLAAWITAPDATAWAAYCGEAMVGFALLTRTTLALCYAVPEALHQGVGRALLREAEARARELGLAALELESTRTAEAFYRRNGYEPAGAVQSWAGLQAQPMRKVF
ncbi:GNAT family N-acetyltransferase [Acidovorax radicis]|uniref:GNAT family N-acetyltransferase n=1 Tax=Acidovorax radicis TaxID=758826 RepID=UPI0002375121|nr:GNAT family N-acetyltransferase [Acidovorax radicis]